MRYYPIFISLENKACLVIGAGKVGMRKISSLLACNVGNLLVLDVHKPNGDLLSLIKNKFLTFERRSFEERDLSGRFLVIAATSDEIFNCRISVLCQERGLLCNIVDQPEKSSFIVPAVVNQGDLTLAISTGGQSPALAKHLRLHLQESIGKEYATLLLLLGRLRPLLLNLNKKTCDNTVVFRTLIGSQLLLEAIATRDRKQAAAVLYEHLPKSLQSRINELLHGLL